MGSVLVAKEGAVVFEQSCGWANAEWKVPNTATTKFRVGSVTKQFTAAAILLLAERGRLQLDDPLAKFVPSAPESWRPVTLRQLLGHTGGVPSFTSQPDYRTWKLLPANPAQQMGRIAEKPLEFTPGESYNYSNTGYLLLGWIVEIASGQNYAAFLREHLFEKLGMNDTGIDSNTALIPQRAAGYSPAGGGLTNAGYIDMTVPGGAGAMYSTTHDLLRWAEGLFGGKVLGAASLEQMTTPGKGDYGLGVSIRTTRGRKIISHTGGIDGFNALLSYYPESRLTVVVLTNVTGSPYPQIGAQLAALALGDPLPAIAGGPPPGAPKGGLRLNFSGTDLARVATMWERIYGKVTVSERAKEKRVSFDISAPNRDEFRVRMIASLRENGVHVIERADGVVFDTEPGAQGGK